MNVQLADFGLAIAELIMISNPTKLPSRDSGRASDTKTTAHDTCVILNAASGKQETSQSPDRIRAALERSGATFDLKLVKSGSDISEAARKSVEDGYTTIVAAGGDGTICAVAGELIGTEQRLGIIPLGTFNYFARSLDIPVEIEEAVDVLVSNFDRYVPVATINDRLFLNNASLGAYPEILKNREKIYSRWGRSRIAAYWSVLKTLVTLRRPLKLVIEVDGTRREVTTPMVFAVNNAFQLDQVGLQGREDVAQGKLVLFIAMNSGRWGMVGHALALLTGTAEPHRNFEMIAAEKIRITTHKSSRLVACDGERTQMSGPFDMKVQQGALRVVVPEARLDDVR